MKFKRKRQILKVQFFLFGKRWAKEDSKKATIAFLLISILFFFYYEQESNLTKELDKCSYFTIFYPEKIRGTTLNGYFYHNGFKIYMSPSASYDDVGDLSKREKLFQKYLIQVNCKDSSNYRLRGEYLIPEKGVNPPNDGWENIPKYLKLRDGGWDYNLFFRGKYID